jgi:hypothetical protein
MIHAYFSEGEPKGIVYKKQTHGNVNIVYKGQLNAEQQMEGYGELMWLQTVNGQEVKLKQYIGHFAKDQFQGSG